ncbi:hypothetical protein BC2926_11780 [Bacillus cereus]|nr:hypothetical protein BC2926_11780 [Bacillus cereus]
MANALDALGDVPKNNCGKEQIAIIPRIIKNERIIKKHPFFKSDITYFSPYILFVNIFYMKL